ncbi:MAG: hypothetical protein A2787_10070 [Omnitrophica WOR_2 bacterium RIFCSPHIGHO2_01_FULL_48_9]|nr:MAG: hypothetical protein A2787_10070 [Omnitrophica WOR_2 bacterium RIFCSPHIGHO2_01_FULL_48_9]
MIRNLSLRKENILFTFLVVLLIGMQLPSFQKDYLPVKDSFSIFAMFYYFYSEFFYHGHLAQWAPFEMYGLPTHFLQWQALTPAGYLCLLVGKILHVENVMLLFKVSILGDQLMVLVGSFLLARILFRNPATVFVVCLAAIASSFWYTQLSFNFRMYYMLPLIFYLFIRFYEEQLPAYFWLAWTAFVVSLAGMTIYFISVWAWILCIFHAWMISVNPKCLLGLFNRERKNIAAAVLFFVTAACFLYFLVNITDGVQFYNVGRDSGAGNTALNEFLSYGENPTVAALVKSFIYAEPLFLPIGSRMDISVYAGLLPLFFFVWALCRVRNRYYFAFLTMAASLVWLSFGGLFASWVYQFPLMKYYRHIGHVYGLVKILLIICAGFGLNDFWMAAAKTRWRLGLLIILFFIFMLDVTAPSQGEAFAQWQFLSSDFKNIFAGYSFERFVYRFYPYIILFAGVLLFSTVRFFMKTMKFSPAVLEKILCLALLAAFGVDMLSFRSWVDKNVPRLPPEEHANLSGFNVSPMAYQEVRAFAPVSERQKKAYALANRKDGLSGGYAHYYSFLMYDPCDPQYRTLLLSTSIKDLMEINPMFPQLLDHCADGRPKLSLMSQPKILSTLEETKNYFQSIHGVMNRIVGTSPAKAAEALLAAKKILSQQLVLTIDPKAVRTDAYQARGTADPLGEVKVEQFDANRIKLQVAVAEKEGAWLVYKDAYHPAWQARVDGKKTPIERAFFSFKAVYLPFGKHAVELRFQHGLTSVLSYFIFHIGTVFALCILAVAVRLMLTKGGTYDIYEHTALTRKKL